MKRDGPGPQHEDLADIRVDGQIGVALPVAQLGIGEAAEGDASSPDRSGSSRAAAGRSDFASERSSVASTRTVTSPASVRNRRPRDADVVVQVEELDQVPASSPRHPSGSRPGSGPTGPPGARTWSCPGTAWPRCGRRLATAGPSRPSHPGRPRAPRRRCGSARSDRRTAGRPAPPAPPLLRAGPLRRTTAPRRIRSLTPPCLRTASGMPG